jgi:hypothetical protein
MCKDFLFFFFLALALLEVGTIWLGGTSVLRLTSMSVGSSSSRLSYSSERIASVRKGVGQV